MSTLQGRKLLIGLIGILCLGVVTLSFLVMNPRTVRPIQHKPSAPELKPIANDAELVRSNLPADPVMGSAPQTTAGDGEWKLVSNPSSPQALVNTPVNRARLTLASPEGSTKDVIYLNLIESGWVVGVVNNNYYEFLREKETVQRARQKYIVSFITKEKDMTIKQFTQAFIEPSQKRGDVVINISNQSEKETYVELRGNAGYALSRVIKGRLSMMVITFFAQNPSEAQKRFARQVLQNATNQPVDSSPPGQGSIPPLS